MGYKKPSETTRNYLENAVLPNHGKTYTVISHRDVISNTYSILQNSGFKIVRELYRANYEANIAQGIYHIVPQNPVDPMIQLESELGMMFAWTNSYDKSTRFQCAIGGYVMVCNNGMVSGDMMNFRRKHTGSADQDMKNQISNQVLHAEKYYRRMIDDKDNLRTVQLNIKEQAELLGRLYYDEEILDVTQLSTVKAQMKNPTYDYQCDMDNAWTFYNHVTHALKTSHPKTWLSDTQKFHEFIVANLLSTMANTPKDIVAPDPIIPTEMRATVPVNTTVDFDLDEIQSEVTDFEDPFTFEIND